MDTPALLHRLKAMEPDLRSAGLNALYLFGSRARGDDNVDSDVDLAFDLTVSADQRFTLLDQARLTERLQANLQTRVDFLERRNLRPRIRAQFDCDAVRVFG